MDLDHRYELTKRRADLMTDSDIEPQSDFDVKQQELPNVPSTKRKRLSYPVGRALFVFVGVILALTPWTAEYFIERFSRAITRGRIQAEYEFAVQTIAQQSNRLREVSLGSQLVFQKIHPSVVSIQTIQTSGSLRANSQGSGFVFSKDGYIITNHHVVEDAGTVWVEMEGHREIQASVVGTDELTDLAVIKIDANNLIPVEWGDSDQLQIGSMVWAVGSPYGLQNSMTQGIISGTERRGEKGPYQEFLQTDAAVNPGNSGGPLVDELGRVVGVNTLIFGNRFQGISFAVPSNLCQQICEQIKKNGKVTRGFLGVVPVPIFQDDLGRLKLDSTQGALLQRVESGTPAYAAGLQEDDVIRQWNGHDIHDVTALFHHIGLTAPWTRAKVRIVRDGEEKTIEVTVAENRIANAH